MSTTLNPIITKIGIKAVFNAQSDGLEARIKEIALGDTGWAPDDSASALKSEKHRIPILGGESISNSQIHLTAVEDGTSLEYWVREIGFYLADGTLLAIWSDPEQPLAHKSAGIDLLLAFDLVLSALPANSVTIDGSAGFTMPPASQSKRGIIRVATQAEVDAGEAEDVAINPKQLQTLIDANTVGHVSLYPEVLTGNSNLAITDNGDNTISIGSDQSIWMRKTGKFNTSDYTLENRTFSYEPSKVYHLRLDTINGFRLLDLADTLYNPSALPETNKQFDTQYDDMLIAQIDNAEITPLMNKTKLQLTAVFRETQSITTDNYKWYHKTTLNYNWARVPETVLAQMGLAFGGVYSGNPSELPVIETRDGVADLFGKNIAKRNRYLVSPAAAIDMNSDTVTKECTISWQIIAGA